MNMSSEIKKIYPTMPNEYPLKEHVVGAAKEFIEDFEENLKGKDIYKSLGINPDKIYLLEGGAGLGKTMSINAINNTLNTDIANKLKVPVKEGETPYQPNLGDFNLLLFEYDIGKYGTAYINMNSRNMQIFFDTAFFYANLKRPVLISIDEADALLLSRKSSVQTHTEDRKVLETFMKNIQIAHDTDNVYLTMMTNVAEIIDEASLRAGRIDRRIKFENPNYLERKIAFENAINQTNKRAGYQVIRNYNTEYLAEISEEFNYADIFQSVETSLRNKAKELIRTKTPGIIRAGYLSQGKLEQAVLNHKVEFKSKSTKSLGFL
jgi:SpoVK/Ycf46/Vps4 family AAA+-type ATPase